MHPAHFFIKYLVIALPNVSLDSVNDNLLLHGVSSITEDYLCNVKAEVGPLPEEYSPWDKTHKPTKRWLNRHKISRMVNQDPIILSINTEILLKPKNRESIERLLISGMGAKEICHRLSTVKIHVPDVAISVYKHFFWNTDIMGLTDWADYFASDDSNRTKVSKSFYATALHAGPDAAMFRLGIDKTLDSKKIMIDVQKELYHTFLETKTLPLSHKKVEMLSSLSRSLAKIDERVQAGDSALHETLKKFEKFKIVSPKSNIPSIADLKSVSAGGRDDR